MSFWDDLTGKTAANASKAAAADTYGKQRSAIDTLMSGGREYADSYAGLAKGYDPYVETGGTANEMLMRLLRDPSSVRSLPGYQFAQEEGLQALDRSAAARGRLQSGRHSKDLLRFGTGLADSTFGDQFARLMGLSGQGQQATGAQIMTTGRGLDGLMDARRSAYGGEMQSAGTIGLGDIAAANARAAGSQNLLNTGMKLGGMALGAAGGFNPLQGAFSFGR